MTLLITVIAASFATLAWYLDLPQKKLNLSTLCFMYWGASLMWMVDAIAEYSEMQAEYFVPAAADMINDAFLGVCVVALGLVVWVISLIIKDPKGVVKAELKKMI